MSTQRTHLSLLAPLVLAVTPLHAQESRAQPAPPASQEDEATPHPSGHVAPEPPTHPLPPPASPHEMAHMMEMGTPATGHVLLEQLEWRHTGEGDAGAWEGQGWYGSDENKLWIKSEGERGEAALSASRVEALWDRIITRWWSLQAGARLDVDSPLPGATVTPVRTWAALGLQGIAPGWFDVEATFYVGEQGRTALHLKSTYDLLLTQRLILQPEVEADLYDRADPSRLIGSGLSELQAGLRLRYEIRREFAPYIGVAGTWRFGGTSDQVRAAGYETHEIGLVLGVRAWL